MIRQIGRFNEAAVQLSLIDYRLKRSVDSRGALSRSWEKQQSHKAAKRPTQPFQTVMSHDALQQRQVEARFHFSLTQPEANVLTFTATTERASRRWPGRRTPW